METTLLLLLKDRGFCRPSPSRRKPAPIVSGVSTSPNRRGFDSIASWRSSVCDASAIADAVLRWIDHLSDDPLPR